MRRRLTLSASLAAISLAACAAPERPTLLSGALYHGFTLIDPSAQTVTEGAWLVIEDGLITARGAGAPPPGDYMTEMEMAGLYALPGFIDVHGHMTAGPHALEFIDGAPTLTMEPDDEATQFHARMALAFGVTTVRNPGAPPQASAAYDARIASGEWIGPTILHAGAVIQPPPFGGTAFSYPTTAEEWDAEAARQAEMGMSYFKLYHGLSEAELAAGVAAARAHGLEPIAHLDQIGWTRAAEIGITGFLHALPTSAELLEDDVRDEYLAVRGADARFMYQWFERVDLDGPRMQELYSVLREVDATVDLTLQVNVLMTGPQGRARLYTEDIRPYLHPRTLASLLQFTSLSLAGWTEQDTARAEAAMQQVYAFSRRLHEENVPIAIGSDGPGGGPMFGLELALMEEAGFTRWQILELATAGGARVMRLEDQTGQLKAGLDADIAFLSGDPLTDLAEAMNVAFVMTDGVLHDAAAMRAEADARETPSSPNQNDDRQGD